MVLLPIPGSPPSKTIDPGTIPPPSTLSNSLKPLVNLDILPISISLNSLDFLFLLTLVILDLVFFFLQRWYSIHYNLSIFRSIEKSQIRNFDK